MASFVHCDAHIIDLKHVQWIDVHETPQGLKSHKLHVFFTGHTSPQTLDSNMKPDGLYACYLKYLKERDRRAELLLALKTHKVDKAACSEFADAMVADHKCE